MSLVQLKSVQKVHMTVPRISLPRATLETAESKGPTVTGKAHSSKMAEKSPK